MCVMENEDIEETCGTFENRTPDIQRKLKVEQCLLILSSSFAWISFQGSTRKNIAVSLVDME